MAKLCTFHFMSFVFTSAADLSRDTAESHHGDMNRIKLTPCLFSLSSGIYRYTPIEIRAVDLKNIFTFCLMLYIFKLSYSNVFLYLY